VVGTNGYCETWMDEGLATYLSHRLMNHKHGKNNALLDLPAGFGWLPNIHRENYRHSGFYGSLGRGEHCAVVQPMDKFLHMANLFSMCYDKGAKVVGMIEDRLGEAAFLDFLQQVYCKYYFRVLRVADFQRELEEYTGQSWQEFFRHWLYGDGLVDWSVKKVRIRQVPCDRALPAAPAYPVPKEAEEVLPPPRKVSLHRAPAPPLRGRAEVAGQISKREDDPPPWQHPGSGQQQVRLTDDPLTEDREDTESLNQDLAEAEAVSVEETPAIRPACHAATCRPAYQVHVLLEQKAEYNEPTVLGFCFDGTDACQLRLPIVPQAGQVRIDDPPAVITPLPDNQVCVQVTLPARPTNIVVDPDHILVDAEPANNSWKSRPRLRFTPLYLQIEETDFTTDYDRWNFIIGPWLFAPTYSDPWFTRSTMGGLRAGFYRTQQFSGGAYLAYRTDFQDVAAGVDLLWNHWPGHRSQVGFSAERSITNFDQDDGNCDRGVLFARYVFTYGSSLYLPPFHYVEAFGTVQNNCLPEMERFVPGAIQFDHQSVLGLHYHFNFLTPYWDPEGGIAFDATYGYGLPIEENQFNAISAQFSCVKRSPSPGGEIGDWGLFRWLAETRWAFRLYTAAGWPNDGLYFSMGGSQLFRGFNLDERQGSAIWIGSIEWRVPVVRHVNWDCCDHVIGLRNLYAAAFYDIGNAYVNNESLGSAAQAIGGGLRADIAWFSFIERTILRVDIAKTVNVPSPVQVWVGFNQPF
jgi:hypothetical protein